MNSFKNVDDPRSARNQLHTAFDIIFIAFTAIICGADGWKDIENYGKSKVKMLKEFCSLRNEIPTDDTFRRFFSALEPSKFKAVFREWVDSLSVKFRHIAIDGKASRRTYDRDKKMLHTISAFSTDAQIVLAQDKVDEKSNEITAIPKLLDYLSVKGNIITIDAMGCQYDIADKITEKEGDYIFSLKGNQGNLSRDVKLYFGYNQKECLSSTQYDKGHGRIETRECIISTNVKQLHELNPKWKTIKTIIQINSKREFSLHSKEGKKRRESNETRYYISSLNEKPEEILKLIRNHWGIENSLHWVLDMTFNEDYSRIRKNNGAEIMAILRHFASNQIRINKPKEHSMKNYRKICAWDDDEMKKAISHFSCQ
jgi:predicted transposase YbfD/YdcC